MGTESNLRSKAGAKKFRFSFLYLLCSKKIPAGGMKNKNKILLGSLFIGIGVFSIIRLSKLSNWQKYKGIPYKWGGSSASTGFDCSGFTQEFYKKQFNKQLPRTSIDQYEVSRSVLFPIPGDLIFFREPGCSVSHVGIYAGGTKFIHSGSSTGIIKSDFKNNDYWRPRFAEIKRF